MDESQYPENALPKLSSVNIFPVSYLQRFDCKNPFLQSQESGDRGQESVKTKSYEDTFCRVESFPDFLQENLQNEHNKNLILNIVDHPITSYSNSIRIIACQFLALRRTGIIGQGFNYLENPVSIILRDSLEILPYAFRKLDAI